MDKIKIYFDCDGVILDTVKKGRELAKLGGYNYKTYDGMGEFYRNVDWYYLIKEAGILNDSIRKIKKILENEIYEGYVLTKLSGSNTEEIAKRDFFSESLKGVPVITLGINENKADKVDAYKSVLIDDYDDNIINWNRAYGIGVQLLENVCDLENNIINDLLLLEQTIGVKNLHEERNAKRLIKSMHM